MYGTHYRDANISNIYEVINSRDNAATHIRPSMYAVFIQDWLNVFLSDNVLIIQSEEYGKDPVTFLQNVVYPFLELKPLSRKALGNLQKAVQSRRKNVTKKNRFLPMNETLKILSEFLKPYNEQLVKLTQKFSFK